MLLWVLCAALAVMAAFPRTGVAKSLRRLLIEWPAQALSRITPGMIILALAAIGATTLAVLLFEAEGLRLMGMMAPEGLVWVAAFDIASLLDVFAAVAMIAAAARLRTLRDTARLILARARQRMAPRLNALRRMGQGRARRVRRPGARAAKTDDDAGWLAGPAWA